MKEIKLPQVVLFKAVALLSILVIAGSCSNLPPVTKNWYINNFASFVRDVDLNHKEFTADDWKLADEKFEKYADTYYHRFKGKMNSDEISKVNVLKTKYIGYKISGQSGTMIREIISGFKAIIEESGEVIESLNSELDSLVIFEE
jgi:hypothetical protein